MGGPVEVPVREAVVYGADEDVERDEGGDGEGLEARRERAPAEGLGAAVVEEGWGGEVALYKSGQRGGGAMAKGSFGGSGGDEMVGLVSEVVDEGDEAGGYADGEDYGPEVVHGIAEYLVLCSIVGQGQYIPVDPMDVVLVVRGVLAQRLETAFPCCR